MKNLLWFIKLALINSTMGDSNATLWSSLSQAIWGGTLSTTLTADARSLSTKYLTKWRPIKPQPKIKLCKNKFDNIDDKLKKNYFNYLPPKTNTLSFDMLDVCATTVAVENRIIDRNRCFFNTSWDKILKHVYNTNELLYYIIIICVNYYDGNI